MKKSILNFALIAIIALGASSCNNKNKEAVSMDANKVAEASDKAVSFVVDTSKSIISWKGSKPTGSHNGTIQLASGTLAAVKNDIQAGKFVIDMNTITDLDADGKMKENLEAHLKGTVEGKEGDFFNVTKFPISTFELIGVDNENGNVVVKGNLTIKDITKAIEFPATVSSSGDTMSLKSSPFMIDRTQWGINFMSKSIFDSLGDKFINDNIEITIELHASKA